MTHPRRIAESGPHRARRQEKERSQKHKRRLERLNFILLGPLRTHRFDSFSGLIVAAGMDLGQDRLHLGLRWRYFHARRDSVTRREAWACRPRQVSMMYGTDVYRVYLKAAANLRPCRAKEHIIICMDSIWVQYAQLLWMFSGLRVFGISTINLSVLIPSHAQSLTRDALLGSK